MDIRLSINAKDGKLEKMMNEVPAQVRNEVVKEALRFYLRAVRDSELESDYIDPSILSNFQSPTVKKMDIEDLKCLIGAKAVATATVTKEVVEVVENKNASLNNIVQNEEYEIEENIEEEYNDENEEETMNNTFINVDIDGEDF